MSRRVRACRYCQRAHDGERECPVERPAVGPWLHVARADGGTLCGLPAGHRAVGSRWILGLPGTCAACERAARD